MDKIKRTTGSNKSDDHRSSRIRLLEAIRAVLYDVDPSSAGQTPPPISSLDLIVMIARYAEPHQQMIIWQNNGMFSIELDVPVPTVRSMELVANREAGSLPASAIGRRMHSSVIYRSHLIMAGGVWRKKSISPVEALKLIPESRHQM